MDKKPSVVDIERAINEYLNILENNFKYSSGNKIIYSDIFQIMKDLSILFENYSILDVKSCTPIVIKRYIPLLDLLLKLDNNDQRQISYEKQVKNAYKLAARRSFEHFLIYYEWDEKDKFFTPRYDILIGYAYYLNKMSLDPTFETVIANLPSGYGKLIANDTPVLTKDGWKKHGDLKVGDYVINKDGNFTLVTSIHPKRLANVRVTFADGEEIECHNQHEWQIYDKNSQTEKQVETTYLMDNCYQKGGRNRFYLPSCDILNGDNKELPVDPYTYGVWLGDGSTKESRITENVNDFEIFNHIPYEITSIYKGISDNVKSYQIKGLSKDLHKINLCYQKHKEEKYINDMYLTASIEQRLELLAGIIDTDGYLDKKKNRYIIVNCGEKLKDDIISLISTFNWRVCVTKVNPKMSTSGIQGRKDVYYIGFNPTVYIPCKLERKQLHNFSVKRRIGISKIEFIKPTEGNCITVDGGLYRVGRTLKLTHNSYLEKLSEAWDFGIDDTGTILSLCSNDDVVKGGSRTVIDVIKSDKFGDVFPNLKWEETDKQFFSKETDGIWKLKNCKLNASYFAKTTLSNVVGCRASKRIHIDDLYADYKEALDENLNIYYYNKFVTVWRKRFVQNKVTKVVISGTMWSPTDFIVKVIELLKKDNKFIPHPTLKYVLISEDGKKAIIQVPALDYETGESTCPQLKKTSELLKERDSIDSYLWETNFQQNPTSPEELFFSWDNLKTYDKVPLREDSRSFAVIDGTRKSGKDYFSMPIFQKCNEDYALFDCIFTKVATKDLIDDIISKIIDNHITLLVIESNVDGGLKKQLDEKLKFKGINFCTIIEKYSTMVKSTRIEAEKGTIKRRLIFPQQNINGSNTALGKFMSNLTLYNSSGRNRNDDAPDSCALFCSEIIEESSKPQKAIAVKKIC